MTVPIASPRRNSGSHPTSEERPVKRIKLTSAHSDSNPPDRDSNLVRRHPLGVRPSGNALTSNINLKQSCGSFARLPDEMIMQLLDYLLPSDILKLGATCRALHAFTRSEELWRALFVESSPESFTWQGTWRSTLLVQPVSNEPRVDCSNLFSDTLHRPFFCAHVPLAGYAANIPPENEIPRLEDLTTEAFESHWVDRPFILTSPVKQWPVYTTWSISQLVSQHSQTAFTAESVDWPLSTYITYMNNNTDESPLYLFDRAFASKMSLTITTTPSPTAAYWPPTCFGPDYFSVLTTQRPDHRWLIIGPARSGSTFHKDPNATSAWNAVLKGSKYWIMFKSSPSIPPPPGVYVSADQSEVTSPLSIAEWLLAFHAEARATPGCVEGVCAEGEVLHVPSGWFHLVLNLEESIALTQNFVPRRRVGAVLRFLSEQRISVSGFGDDVPDPYGLFVERLRESHPDVLEEGLRECERLGKGARGRWEELTKGDGGDGNVDADEEGGGGGFSFGFGGDDDDADIP